MTTSASPKIKKTNNGIKVSGALVFTSVSSLLEESKDHFKNHQSETFEIDCSTMEKIDSAGIALCIEWQRQALANKFACQFKGLSKQALSLIKAYRVQALISV